MLSSSSSSPPQFLNDVFLNFRGEDVRWSFVSQLYKSLSDAGIITFLDDENLEKGTDLEPELMRAIETSRICIVVFSKTYITSRWCLKELVHIMNCRKTTGQMVLPIFYYIDPAVVRHQKDGCGEALQATAKRRLPEGETMENVLSNWMTVLTEAANISGWHTKNFRNEVELISEIVKDVSRKLKEGLLNITEFPVGLDTRVQQMFQFIQNYQVSRSLKITEFPADSDAVWNEFLPADSHFMDSIISNSPSLANAPSEKALYLALSDRPIIIDNGLKSFQLDRKSGKICYMLAARSLSIEWVDDEQYWKWITMPNSRFPEVAKLLHVSWFDIHGRINTNELSPNTEYAAYVVFKMINPQGFQNLPIVLSVFVEGGHSSTKNVCLDPNVKNRSHNKVVGLQCPNVRSDGWLEIEMGEFSNSGIENEEVQMKVLEKSGHWKKNIFIEGIEVRPK